MDPRGNVEHPHEINVERAHEIARAVRETEVTAWSPDRRLSVTVVPGNVVTSLELAPAAMRVRRGADLARVVLDTIREAFRQLAEQVASRVEELAPESIDRAELLDGLAGRPPKVRPAGDDGPRDDEVPEPELPVEWAERGAAARLAEAERDWEAFTATLERFSAPVPADAERFAAAESTGRSPGGEVEVTIRPGAVVGLTISDVALDRDRDELAGEILMALHQAQAELASQLAEHAQALTGPALDVRDLVGRYQPSEEERR